MKETPYFGQDKINEIAEAVMDTVGYDPAARSTLLASIPTGFVRDVLEDGNAAPHDLLYSNLAILNTTPRLKDGVIPFQRFLENATSRCGVYARGSIFIDALQELTRRTSGAPVDVGSLPELPEAIVFRDDMVPFAYMNKGISVSSSVAKLVVPRYEEGKRIHSTNSLSMDYLGTGWLVSPTLLMTNYHVVAARNELEEAPSFDDLKSQAKGTSVQFDYDFENSKASVKDVECIVCYDKQLDYALLRIADAARKGLRFKPVTALLPKMGSPVNIIQHPSGRHKHFAIRNNLVTKSGPRDLQYVTDTMAGSSGSPVFDDEWNVVAMHRGMTKANGVRFNGREVKIVNVGTLINAIFSHWRDYDARSYGEVFR